MQPNLHDKTSHTVYTYRILYTSKRLSQVILASIRGTLTNLHTFAPTFLLKLPLESKRQLDHVYSLPTLVLIHQSSDLLFVHSSSPSVGLDSSSPITDRKAMFPKYSSMIVHYFEVIYQFLHKKYGNFHQHHISP